MSSTGRVDALLLVECDGYKEGDHAKTRHVPVSFTKAKIGGMSQVQVGKDAVVIEADAIKNRDVMFKHLSSNDFTKNDPMLSSYVHEYSTKAAEMLLAAAGDTLLPQVQELHHQIDGEVCCEACWDACTQCYLPVNPAQKCPSLQ